MASVGVLSARNLRPRSGELFKEAKEGRPVLITKHEGLRCYGESEGLPVTNFGNAIYGAARNVNREYQTVSEALFGEGTPESAEYIRVSRDVFESPFFDALAAYLGEHPRSTGNVQIVLDLPLLDAKAIHSELV